MNISAELTGDEVVNGKLMAEITLKISEQNVREAVADWLEKRGLSVPPEHLETTYKGQFDSIDFDGFSYKFLSKIPPNLTPLGK